MTMYVMMICQWCDTIFENVKQNTHILHLFLNRIASKGGTNGTINCKGFLNSLGEFNPKLMSPLVVLSASER